MLEFCTQRTIVIRATGQRGEYLLAVDEPTAISSAGRCTKSNRSGRSSTAFGEGLRIDGALVQNPPVVHSSVTVVLAAHLVIHFQVIRQRSRPQAGRDMHVPGQCG